MDVAGIYDLEREPVTEEQAQDAMAGATVLNIDAVYDDGKRKVISEIAIIARDAAGGIVALRIDASGDGFTDNSKIHLSIVRTAQSHTEQ